MSSSHRPWTEGSVVTGILCFGSNVLNSNLYDIIRPRANFSHRGYAFINLSNPAHARLFLKTMSGLRATSAGCCSPSSSFPW